ncbi:hypothetical protein [Nocardia sp. NPDC005998]|uniref:hypothetical protein n=1 Tax=Nocardia sp. NPDC005998 TaxID=3156894 RepID=UPI0033B1753D
MRAAIGKRSAEAAEQSDNGDDQDDRVRQHRAVGGGRSFAKGFALVVADDAEDDARRSGDHDGEPQNITTDSTVAARQEKLMIEKIGAKLAQGYTPERQWRLGHRPSRHDLHAQCLIS